MCLFQRFGGGDREVTDRTGDEPVINLTELTGREPCLGGDLARIVLYFIQKSGHIWSIYFYDINGCRHSYATSEHDRIELEMKYFLSMHPDVQLVCADDNIALMDLIYRLTRGALQFIETDEQKEAWLRVCIEEIDKGVFDGRHE